MSLNAWFLFAFGGVVLVAPLFFRQRLNLKRPSFTFNPETNMEKTLADRIAYEARGAYARTYALVISGTAASAQDLVHADKLATAAHDAYVAKFTPAANTNAA